MPTGPLSGFRKIFPRLRAKKTIGTQLL